MAIPKRSRSRTVGDDKATGQKRLKSASAAMPPYTSAHLVPMQVTPPSSSGNELFEPHEDPDLEKSGSPGSTKIKSRAKQPVACCRSVDSLVSSNSSSSGHQRLSIKKRDEIEAAKLYRALGECRVLVYHCLLNEKEDASVVRIARVMRRVRKATGDSGLQWADVKKRLLGYHARYGRGMGSNFELQMRTVFKSELQKLFDHQRETGHNPQMETTLLSPQAFTWKQWLQKSVLDTEDDSSSESGDEGYLTPESTDEDSTDEDSTDEDSTSVTITTVTRTRSPSAIKQSIEHSTPAFMRGTAKEESPSLYDFGAGQDLASPASPGSVILPRDKKQRGDISPSLGCSPPSHRPPQEVPPEQRQTSRRHTNATTRNPLGDPGSEMLEEDTFVAPRPFRELELGSSPYGSEETAGQVNNSAASHDNDIEELQMLFNSPANAVQTSTTQGVSHQKGSRSATVSHRPKLVRHMEGKPTPEPLRLENARIQLQREGPKKPVQVPHGRYNTPAPEIRLGRRGNTIPPEKFYGGKNQEVAADTCTRPGNTQAGPSSHHAHTGGSQTPPHGETNKSSQEEPSTPINQFSRAQELGSAFSTAEKYMVAYMDRLGKPEEEQARRLKNRRLDRRRHHRSSGTHQGEDSNKRQKSIGHGGPNPQSPRTNRKKRVRNQKRRGGGSQVRIPTSPAGQRKLERTTGNPPPSTPPRPATPANQSVAQRSRQQSEVSEHLFVTPVSEAERSVESRKPTPAARRSRGPPHRGAGSRFGQGKSHCVKHQPQPRAQTVALDTRKSCSECGRSSCASWQCSYP